MQGSILGAPREHKHPHGVLDETTAHVEIDERGGHDDVVGVGAARDDTPRVELAARAGGARRGARLEHGAERGGRGRDPRGGHAAEGGGSRRPGARVADEAGEERIPRDGVPRGHFVEQAGRGAREPRARVGGEEDGGRDRDGAGEGGGLEQRGVRGGGSGEGGMGREEAEQGGHRRRRPRSSRHHVERSERVSSGVPQKQSGEAAREERLTGNHSSPITTTPCRWQPRRWCGRGRRGGGVRARVREVRVRLDSLRWRQWLVVVGRCGHSPAARDVAEAAHRRECVGEEETAQQVFDGMSGAGGF